jgi:glycosyltransferase involved in cell wall biosynthesis
LAQIAITVPCYNEADRFRSDAFIEFVREYPDVMFIFVDDGSTDDTARLLNSLAKNGDTQIRLISFEKNHGKAEAVRQGMLRALAGGARYVGYWDADLATPLSAIFEFAGQPRTCCS